jgi:hypothetical protein
MLRHFPRSIRRAITGVAPLLGLIGCSATPPPAPAPAARAPRAAAPAPTPTQAPKASFDPAHPVMLGIDVLEAEGFAAVRGRRSGS